MESAKAKLGTPATMTSGDFFGKKTNDYKWRREGYVVEIDFLSEDYRPGDGSLLKAGSIDMIVVSPAAGGQK